MADNPPTRYRSAGTDIFCPVYTWGEYSELCRRIYAHGNIHWAARSPDFPLPEPEFQICGWQANHHPNFANAIGYSHPDLERKYHNDRRAVEYFGAGQIRVNFSDGIGAMVSKRFVQQHWPRTVPYQENTLHSTKVSNIFGITLMAYTEPEHGEWHNMLPGVLCVGKAEIKWRMRLFDPYGQRLQGQFEFATFKTEAWIVENPLSPDVDMWVGIGTDNTMMGWLPTPLDPRGDGLGLAAAVCYDPDDLTLLPPPGARELEGTSDLGLGRRWMVRLTQPS